MIINWEAVREADLLGYRVYKAEDPNGPFVWVRGFTLADPYYVDFDVTNGTTYYYTARSVNQAREESTDSNMGIAQPDTLDDEAFLDLVAQTAFDYFWFETNPDNGLVRDRSRRGSTSSIAAVGFGLSALTVGVDRGWISREAVRERALTTLNFFWNSPHGPEADATGYQGFYYHFLNMETGRRSGNAELSTIDTALLMGGVLHAKAYFDQDDPDEARIRALSDSLFNRVNWQWASPRPPRVSHGWRPGPGFLPYDWGGYNEAMLIYILALGSPTYPIPEAAWTSWVSGYRWQTHYGRSFVVFPPLFGHQYTHIWIDFRGIQDAYMQGKGIDYFENSHHATLANRDYAIENPQGWQDYGPNIWGLTASDIPTGYRARGAPPAQNDDGTIAPTAAGGSYAFTPDESLAALRAMYDTYREKLWGPYGFRDAFNPTQNWFDRDHIGIDQGPIVLMIENGRTGSIWRHMMTLDVIQRGLERAGFVQAGTGSAVPEVSEQFNMEAAYPNPFTQTLYIPYQLAQPTWVRVTVHDVLGRLVETVVDDTVPAGAHVVSWQVSDTVPAGSYFYTLHLGTTRHTRMAVRLP